MLSRPYLLNLSDSDFRLLIQRYLDRMDTYPFGWGLPSAFGDGSDGDVTLADATTSLASHVIKQYRNLIIPAGKTLTTTETSAAALLIWVQNRCVIDGTVTMDGKGGAASTDYTASFGGSGGGGGGGETGGGVSGSRTRVLGGAGGGVGAAGTIGNAMTAELIARFRTDSVAKADVISSYGVAGGNGGTGSSGNPGSGGKGGGVIVIVAKQITVTGTLTTDGENGTNPSGTSGDSGGGGGGTIYIVTQSYSNTGSIAASGGLGSTIGSYGNGGNGGGGLVVIEKIPTS